jgi:hypothetical protein
LIKVEEALLMRDRLSEPGPDVVKQQRAFERKEFLFQYPRELIRRPVTLKQSPTFVQSFDFFRRRMRLALLALLDCFIEKS